jgi:hypothetical protein
MEMNKSEIFEAVPVSTAITRSFPEGQTDVFAKTLSVPFEMRRISVVWLTCSKLNAST